MNNEMWIEEMVNKIVKGVKVNMSVYEMDLNTAFRCYMENSCAGSAPVAKAKEILGVC